MQHRWTSLIMILLFSVCPFSEACPCVDFHLQSFFCNWDFVIKGEFLSERNVTTDSGFSIEGYDILVKQVFKGGNNLKNIIFVSRLVKTTCETSYNYRNTDCLIVGRGSSTPDGMYLNACSYLSLWSQLSANQMKGIQGAYSAGCNCMICSGEDCAPTTCPLMDLDRDSYQALKQRCVSKNDVCTWESIQ
ncbi:metalloproteinase inhibitor 1-like isoform X2 [Lissotriton helveticus]